MTHDRISITEWRLLLGNGGYEVFFDLNLDGQRINRLPMPEAWKHDEIEALHELFGTKRV